MLCLMYLPIEDWIQQVYAFMGQLNISVTALIAAAVIFCLALLFAVREAASWFFKVDDVKRDVRKLHKLTLDLESEIRSLHSLIEAAQANSRGVDKHTPAMTPPLSPPLSTVADKKEATKHGGFPISH